MNLGRSRLVSLAIVDKEHIVVGSEASSCLVFLKSASDPIHDFSLSTVGVLLAKKESKCVCVPIRRNRDVFLAPKKS